MDSNLKPFKCTLRRSLNVHIVPTMALGGQRRGLIHKLHYFRKHTVTLLASRDTWCWLSVETCPHELVTISFSSYDPPPMSIPTPRLKSPISQAVSLEFDAIRVLVITVLRIQTPVEVSDGNAAPIWYNKIKYVSASVIGQYYE